MSLSATGQWDFETSAARENYDAALREYPAQAIIDLAALRDNMRHIVGMVEKPGSGAGGTEAMGVVKADAYGHGLVPTALAALAGVLHGWGLHSRVRP